MRKLRRLPWRIPKSHNHQASEPKAEACPRIEPERERPSPREDRHAQPVAFAGGRYVYGETPSIYGESRSVAPSTEIRRKTRHRVILVAA